MSAAAQALRVQHQQRRRRLVVGQFLAAKPALRNSKNDEKSTAQQADSKGGGPKSVSDGQATADSPGPRLSAAELQTLTALLRHYPCAAYLNTCAGGKATRHRKTVTAAQRPCPARRWRQPLPWKERLPAPTSPPPNSSITAKKNPPALPGRLTDTVVGPYAALRDLRGLSSINNPPPLPPLAESESAFLAAHTRSYPDFLDMDDFESGEGLLDSASPLDSLLDSFDEEQGLFGDVRNDRWSRSGTYTQRSKQLWPPAVQLPALRQALPSSSTAAAAGRGGGGGGLPSYTAAAASTSVSIQRPAVTHARAPASATQRSASSDSSAQEDFLADIDSEMDQIVEAVCRVQTTLARFLKEPQHRNICAEIEAEKLISNACETIRTSLDAGLTRDKAVLSLNETIRNHADMHTKIDKAGEQKRLEGYRLRSLHELYEHMKRKNADELGREVDYAMPGWLVEAEMDQHPAALAWGLLQSMAQEQRRAGLAGGSGVRFSDCPSLKVLASAVTCAAVLASNNLLRRPLDPLACALVCPVHWKFVKLFSDKSSQNIRPCSSLSITSLYDIICHLTHASLQNMTKATGVPQSGGILRYSPSLVFDLVGTVVLQPEVRQRVNLVKGILSGETGGDLSALVDDCAYVLIAEELYGPRDTLAFGPGADRMEDTWEDDTKDVLNEWAEEFFSHDSEELEEEGSGDPVGGGETRPLRPAFQASSSPEDSTDGNLVQDLYGCCPYDCFWAEWNGRVFEEFATSEFKISELVAAMKMHGLLDLEYDTSAEHYAISALEQAEIIVQCYRRAQQAYEEDRGVDTELQEFWHTMRQAQDRVMQREVTNPQTYKDWRLKWLLARPQEAFTVQQYEGANEVEALTLRTDIGMLRSGLLAVHPTSWGRLVTAMEEYESNAPRTLSLIARYAMLGLTALVGINMPIEHLRLTPCVAAGYIRRLRDESDPSAWEDDGDYDGTHMDTPFQDGIRKAIETFNIMAQVPPLRFHIIPQTGWTCAPPPQRSSRLHLPSGPQLPLTSPKRQEEQAVMVLDTMVRIFALPWHYRALARYIGYAAAIKSDEATERAQKNVQMLQGMLEEFAFIVHRSSCQEVYVDIDPDHEEEDEEDEELRDDRQPRTVGEAAAGAAGTSGREDGAGCGYSSSTRQPLRQYSYEAQQPSGVKGATQPLPPPPPPPPAPGGQKHFKIAAQPDPHHRPHLQEQSQHKQQHQPSQRRRTTTQTEMPCLSSTTSDYEAVLGLLPLVCSALDWRREEGKTAAASVVPVATNPPPVSMAVVGPERITLVMLLLHHFSELVKGESGMTTTHSRLGCRVMAIKTPRAGSVRLGSQGKDAPWPPSADQPATVLLADIQPVVMPCRTDPKHTHAFEWATIAAHALHVTATSKWADYMRSLQHMLIKKKYGAAVLCGIGVEGVQRALLMIAKIQEEMLSNGMDCNLCVSHIKLFNPSKDSPRGKGNNRSLRRHSSSGGTSPVTEPLFNGSQPSYELECLLRELQKLAQLDDYASTSGWPSNVGPFREVMHRASSYMAYLLDALSHADSEIRRAVVVEFRLTQCEPQRPNVPVLPRGEGTMQQRRLRDALLQKP